MKAGNFVIVRGHPLYCHPFHDGWIPNRADMGFDGTFRKHIYAPFKGRVIYAGPFNGWNGSQGIVIEARRSDNRNLRSWIPTARLYFTEGCAPVLRTGDHFRAGQKIARAVNSPYGNSYGHGALGAIEFGVAALSPEGVQPNTYASALGQGWTARQMVLKFCRGCEDYLKIKGPTTTVDAGRA